MSGGVGAWLDIVISWLRGLWARRLQKHRAQGRKTWRLAPICSMSRTDEAICF